MNRNLTINSRTEPPLQVRATQPLTSPDPFPRLGPTQSRNWVRPEMPFSTAETPSLPKERAQIPVEPRLAEGRTAHFHLCHHQLQAVKDARFMAVTYSG